MDYYVYESVYKKDKVPINTFIASINVSSVHWHGEYEFIGVLSGELNIRIGTEEYTLSMGDMIIVNPNEMHALRGMGEEACLCMVMQLDESLVETDGGETRFYLNSTSDEPIECGYKYLYGMLASIVYEGILGEKDNVMRMWALIYTFLADLFEYAVYDKRFKERETLDEKKLVVSSIDYMNINLAAPEVLDDICKKYGVSRKTLDRNFNTVLGITAKGILADLRMERAKQMLKSTDKSLGFIMDNCGFGSEKTFYRVFKEATGLTPMDFRAVGVVNGKIESFNSYLDYNQLMAQELLKKTVKDSKEDFTRELQKRLEKI